MDARDVTAERIYLYDTTLRDGAQTQGVDFSPADKTAIAKELDRLGVEDRLLGLRRDGGDRVGDHADVLG